MSKVTVMMNPYEQLGGEKGVKALVDRFYELMDTLPAVRELRAMHAKSLDQARDKLALFLSGWLGGPNRHQEPHGQTRLRARHLPFAIGDREREQWMLCMNRALEDQQVPKPLRGTLSEAFQKMADHMQNEYLSQKLERMARHPEAAGTRTGEK